MLANDITLGTTVFALRSLRSTSSVRSDNNQAVDHPRLLTISHEVAKSGRVSSAIMIDDTVPVTVGTSQVGSDTTRVLLKLQYNPLSGRTTTSADLKLALAELAAFISVEANIDKILNREF